jgi:Domain of unknown function (DUF1844)
VAGDKDRGVGDDDVLPSIDFTTFVASLSHSALMHLGEAPPLPGHPAEKNFPLARQTIDLLGVLEEKTKGNLTGDEERILAHTLFDLRTRFVELSKASAKESGKK